mmetsp:Transcript_74856/g.208129  ORF Transcript_74856/g.208129 Transcript_74856/m.208129 type:complete len:203 (+) Transcript_74856:241-849(+)
MVRLHNHKVPRRKTLSSIGPSTSFWRPSESGTGSSLMPGLGLCGGVGSSVETGSASRFGSLLLGPRTSAVLATAAGDSTSSALEFARRAPFSILNRAFVAAKCSESRCCRATLRSSSATRWRTSDSMPNCLRGSCLPGDASDALAGSPDASMEAACHVTELFDGSLLILKRSDVPCGVNVSKLSTDGLLVGDVSVGLSECAG